MSVLSPGPILHTQRLILRPWRDEDKEPFAAINADPQVMRYFEATQTREESDAAVERIRGNFAKYGFGFFALELKETREMIGFTGLSIPRYTTPFSPFVEIGWRLAVKHWGKGLATEAALESLRFGFEDLKLEEIVSFTAAPNAPSMRVMERIGMTRDPSGDFDHPLVPEGHPLRRHVLYRIRRSKTGSKESRARQRRIKV